VSAGGRVLCATAVGEDLAAARAAAYDLVAGVGLDSAQHRTDIALTAVRGEITLPG
jgi:phosphoribosylamine--glycine ligase